MFSKPEQTGHQAILLKPVQNLDIEVGRHGTIDLFEKSQALPMAAPRLAVGKDGSSGNVQSRKQNGRAVTNIIVRDAFDIARPIRKIGAFQIYLRDGTIKVFARRVGG